MARFFRRGISKVHFLPSVAGASPTRIEIAAGTPMSQDIATVQGFQLSNAPIAVPNLDDRFTAQIEGEDTVQDSGFTLNDDDTNTDLRDALPKGTEGWIVLMPYGDVPTKRCEVWPVRVSGYNDIWSTGNDPAQAAVQFVITDVPEQDGTIPAT